jgi:hypothetical protein
LIWRDVIDVCEGVTEFVFLGYSLPRDDFLTRAAIRRATAHRSSDEFKCLVVDHDMSDAKFLDFATCFTGFDRNRNWLKWSFGCGEDGLPREIQRRLRKAQLARV